jgi:hypothetical protein
LTHAARQRTVFTDRYHRSTITHIITDAPVQYKHKVLSLSRCLYVSLGSLLLPPRRSTFIGGIAPTNFAKNILINSDPINAPQYTRMVCHGVGTYSSLNSVAAARMSWAPPKVIEAVTLGLAGVLNTYQTSQKLWVPVPARKSRHACRL